MNKSSQSKVTTPKLVESFVVRLVSLVVVFIFGISSNSLSSSNEFAYLSTCFVCFFLAGRLTHGVRASKFLSQARFSRCS